MTNVRIIVIILGLAVLLYVYIKNENLSRISKFITIAFTLLAVVFGILFEAVSTKQSEINSEKLNAFNAGKTLICNGIEVTAEEFVFIGGTKVFSAKSNLEKNRLKDTQGTVIIPIENCQ